MWPVRLSWTLHPAVSYHRPKKRVLTTLMSSPLAETEKKSSRLSKESYDVQEIEAVVPVADDDVPSGGQKLGVRAGIEPIVTPPSFSQSQQKRLYRKIDLRLLPILIAIQVCSYLDRGM